MNRPFRWRPFTHWCAVHQRDPKAWPKGQYLKVLDHTAEVHLNGDGWQVRWSWKLGFCLNNTGGDLSYGIMVRKNPLSVLDRGPTMLEAFATARHKCEIAIATSILSPEVQGYFDNDFVNFERSGNARDRRRKRRMARRVAMRWAQEVLAHG